MSATQALILPPETDTDPKVWKTGERCALVIRSPFAGQVLVRVATDRVVHSTVINMQGTSAIIPLTVGSDWSPNAWILVSVVRPVEPDKPWRVHRAFGITGIAIAQPERQALVRISPLKPLQSGENLSCTISVSSSIGTAIPNAAVAVSIVDEGILSLTRFETPDPFAFFTAQRALTLSADDCYRSLMPEVPKGTSTVGGDTERTKSLGHKPPIASRRVKPVTFWHGNLRTDAQGQVQVQSTIPKTFAGQLRIMAIADAGPACGSSATTTVIRGPLVLQSSWPRALAPGDTFQVPIAVFSEIKSSTVSFVVQVPEKFLRIVPCSGSIAVGSDGRGQAMLEATTLNALGSASIAVMIQDASGSQTAWEELEIPIHPITPMETISGEVSATSGAVFRVPTQQGHMAGDTSQISLHIGPTPTLNIARGLDTLYRYPYGCAEQTISSIFSLIALPDLAKQVGYISFSKEGLNERLRRGILRLQSMEVSGGGIAMWPGSPTVWPWASISAAHLLCEAKRSGYSIPEDFLLRLLTFTRQHADRHDEKSLETSAFACYVLASAGRADLVILNRFTERLGPSRASSAWLAAAWALAGRKDLAQRLLPRDLPSVRSDRRLSDDLASPTRDLAIQVLAMVEAMPQHPSLGIRVADLAKYQTWYSTQDTAMAVFALGKYLQIAPKTAPYERIRLLVNGAVVTEETQGKTIDWKGDPTSRIEIAVFGSATAAAHVSWIQTGIPLSPPPPQDHGLKVVRRWTTLQGVEIKPEQITVGDLIQVHLEVLSGTPRRHVVIEDILPAGMELENPRLSGSAPNDGGSRVNTLDLRDDRLIAVGDIRYASSPLTHTYLLRAVTAGTFTVPPVRAECMYDSSLTSITGTGTVAIFPKSP